MYSQMALVCKLKANLQDSMALLFLQRKGRRGLETWWASGSRSY